MNVLAQQLISDSESYRRTVYDDATGQALLPGMTIQGHPTVGYGRALDVHGINETEAAYLRDNTISEIEATLNGYAWFPTMDLARQAALIDMAYNMGLANFYEFVAMIHALEQSNFIRASESMLVSKWARQVPDRAKRDAHIMQYGTLP